MDKIVQKRPRGRPPTDKIKEVVKTTTTRGRPPNKATPIKAALNKELIKATPIKAALNKELIKATPIKAAPNKELIKAAPRGRPKTNKEVQTKEQKDDSIKTQMDKTESIMKARQPRKSKTILDIPKIKENERNAEKNAYKQEMHTILRERLRQGKAKIILDQNIMKLEARMNGL